MYSSTAPVMGLPCNYSKYIPSLGHLPSVKLGIVHNFLPRYTNITKRPKTILKCSSVSSIGIDLEEREAMEEKVQGIGFDSENKKVLEDEVREKFPSIDFDVEDKLVHQEEAEDKVSSVGINLEAKQVMEEKVEEKDLAGMWEEIQGSKDWEGLLEPINPILQQEIIRYGEFAQGCYDAFDFDPNSKYCGTCKYQGGYFFEKLDMVERGYQVSRYLYATSNINLPNFFQKSKMTDVWSTHANWMGYVAVSTDEEVIKRLGRRDIVVAWRGTVTYLEWLHDLKDILHPAFFGEDPSVKIESGFFDLYTKKEENCDYCTFSAREQILAEIKRIAERYKDDKHELSITITGHSLGAALALLSAYDIAEMNVNVRHDEGRCRIPITVYSFSGPRVGNLHFKERCDELGIKVLRVINRHDKVPTVPGIITNEKFQYQKYIEDVISFPWSYAHVGVELAYDHKESPFLKETNDMACLHNLEALLHLVDGYHRDENGFRSITKRDIALVNKSCNFLKKDYGVPPHWRQDENKGMVRDANGRWILPERPRLEAHPLDTAHHLAQILKNLGRST